jgi:hypothetical protein
MRASCPDDDAGRREARQEPVRQYPSKPATDIPRRYPRLRAALLGDFKSHATVTRSKARYYSASMYLRQLMIGLCLPLLVAVALPASAQAGFVGSETITFEDYGEQTPITNQYEPEGIVFSGASAFEPPFIAWDDISATNPVLSGNPRFHGPIHAEFVAPGTPLPTTVDGLSLLVGYIDDPDSVTLTVTTTTGSETIVADQYGFNELESSASNITGFSVEETGFDEEGFEIDNVSFTPGAPPVVAPPAPPPAPAPPAPPPPPPTPPPNPCAPVSGSVGTRLLASIKCTAELTKLEAECAFAILPFAPLKAFDAAKTAAGLYDLRKVSKSARPIAKLYNLLKTVKILKDAPPGFRTGTEILGKLKDAHTAWKVVSLLPDIAKSLSASDYEELALDLAEIAGLKPCVEAVADSLE